MSSDLATVVYSYFFVGAAILAGVGIAFRHFLHKFIDEHMKEIRQELSCLTEMDKRTSRIEYALYNDGKTGLINRVEALLENQQIIKTEVEIIKARAENDSIG
jgi:hypothetical protein